MGNEPFVVNVARLRRVPGATRKLHLVGPADTSRGAVPGPADSRVPEGADASFDVELESFAGGVMVVGTVAAPWEGMCRRCTTPIGGTITAWVRERFTEAGGTPDDEDAYPMVDDTIDLGALVDDVLVLELPLAALCSSACKGLCPMCGTDRNESTCDCVAPRDSRWASLDVLRSTS